MEKWIDIKDYEGIYQVSDRGRVKRLSRIIIDKNGVEKELNEMVINGGYYPNGYQFVCLRKNGVNSNRMNHRLVAENFMPNDNSDLVVNHINDDKSDNRLENLEWVTQAVNLRKAIETGQVYNQCKIIRPVKVTFPDGMVKLFKSMKDVSLHLGYKRGWLNGVRHRMGVDHFEYIGHEFSIKDRGVEI